MNIFILVHDQRILNPYVQNRKNNSCCATIRLLRTFLVEKKSFCYSSLFCYHTILEQSSNANHCDIFDRVVLSFCPKTVNNRPSVSLSQFFLQTWLNGYDFATRKWHLCMQHFLPEKDMGQILTLLNIMLKDIMHLVYKSSSFWMVMLFNNHNGIY